MPFPSALHVIPRMTLYETTIDDVKYDRDLFVPLVKKGSKGVRGSHIIMSSLLSSFQALCSMGSAKVSLTVQFFRFLFSILG